MVEPTVVVGKITRAHGVHGEVAVLVLSEVPERFADGANLLLEDGGKLTIASTRPDRGRLLVTFEGVADRDAAQQLRGRLLVVPQSRLPELPEGAWWPHQLEGCAVVTEAGRSLGDVKEVVSNPANDIWVAVDETGDETLVPALRDVIVDVDLEARRIVVREVPGLTAPED
jgi:16S rRNA processing protein RimM